MTGAGFSYVQARIQARHGRRPDESDWSRLESCESAHAYLEAAHTGILASWAEGLTTDGDIHRLESSIRLAWRRYLERVASWSPEAWRDAIVWCARLPAVPTTALVAATGERPDWLPRDGGVNRVLEEEAPAGLAEWREEWRARMPSQDAGDRAGLAALEAAVDSWLAANRDLERASVARAAHVCERLEHRATSVFRRHALGPAALFAHLLLTALDVQRFRGGLVRRLASSGQGVAGAAA